MPVDWEYIPLYDYIIYSTSTNADARHQEVWRPANLLLRDYDYCQRTLFMF